MGELQVAYAEAVSLWRELRLTIPSLSAPFVVSPAPGYGTAALRLLIVGQETFGWGEGIDHGQPIEQLVDILSTWYESFDLGAKYRSTPFWAAAHQINAALNRDAETRSFLWSNLVKMDSGKSRVPAEVEDRVAALRLLQLEIAAHRPEVVIFFTGPRYDGRLRASFPGAVFEPGDAFLSRVEHPDLPKHSYRTYHPRYLRMSRRWNVISDLISRCQVT